MNKFLLGALSGLVVGILIAPDKGENTRDNLMDTADKWRDKFNRMVGRADAKLNDLRDLLESDIEGLAADVRHKILSMLDEAEEMAYSPRRTRATSNTNGAVN